LTESSTAAAEVPAVGVVGVGDVVHDQPDPPVPEPDQMLDRPTAARIGVGADEVDLGIVELGGDGQVPKIRHFRNDAREYVFENEIPQVDDRSALLFLLAYEAAFRQLGDMGGGDEDE
jgi:hypothetical protein